MHSRVSHRARSRQRATAAAWRSVARAARASHAADCRDEPLRARACPATRDKICRGNINFEKMDVVVARQCEKIQVHARRIPRSRTYPQLGSNGRSAQHGNLSLVNANSAIFALSEYIETRSTSDRCEVNLMAEKKQGKNMTSQFRKIEQYRMVDPQHFVQNLMLLSDGARSWNAGACTSI